MTHELKFSSFSHEIPGITLIIYWNSEITMTCTIQHVKLSGFDFIVISFELDLAVLAGLLQAKVLHTQPWNDILNDSRTKHKLSACRRPEAMRLIVDTTARLARWVSLLT